MPRFYLLKEERRLIGDKAPPTARDRSEVAHTLNGRYPASVGT